MAIAFVKSATNFDNLGTTSLAATFASNTVVDNLLVAFVTGDAGDVVSPPAGWTNDLTIELTADTKLSSFHRIVASAATVYTFTSVGGTMACLSILEYSGIDTTTPKDVTESTNSQASTTAPVLTGVSDTTVGSMLVGCISGGGSAVITVPASMTGRTAVISTKPQRHSASDEASDTTGNRTGTFGVTESNCAILFRLRPSGSGAVQAGGGAYDDRFRFRPSVFSSGTSTLGTKRAAWPDDASDGGWRDAIAGNRSRNS